MRKALLPKGSGAVGNYGVLRAFFSLVAQLEHIP